MKSRFFASLVLVLVTIFLGGCASSQGMFLDGSCAEAVSVGQGIDRSATYHAEYKDCKKDASGKIVSGTRVGSLQLSISPTVIGQMAIGAVGGMGAALIQRDGMIETAKAGKCEGVCAPIFNNSVQSIAESMNQNSSNVNLGACSDGSCLK